MDMLHIHPSLSSKKGAVFLQCVARKEKSAQYLIFYTFGELTEDIKSFLPYLSAALSRRCSEGRRTPVAEMRRTRKSSSEMTNTHFSWLKARPMVSRMENKARRGFQCCSLDLRKILSSSKKEKEHILVPLGYCND